MAPPAELTLVTLYDILRLRVDVFVVEQECAYPELDGHDLAPTTVHRWIAEETGGLTGTGETGGVGGARGSNAPSILSYVRVIEVATAAEDAGPNARERKLGRVVTRPDARGQGLSATLIRDALQGETGPVTCEAQSHLETWYGGFGFERRGPEFVEDGIPHLPMIKP